jgi:hypothetical protein
LQALVFLNNKNASTSVTCDAQCMETMLALRPPAVVSSAEQARSSTSSSAGSSASVMYAVQEVWSGGANAFEIRHPFPTTTNDEI